MDTVEKLVKDHQAVYAKLESLAKAVAQVEQDKGGEQIVKELAQFFAAEVSLHFGVEERALFPMLSRFPWLRSGPVAVMLSEHEVVKKQLTQYQEMVDTGAYRQIPKEFQALTISLVENLRGHAEKEDSVLFPMARQFLTPQMQEEVSKAAEMVYSGAIG